MNDQIAISTKVTGLAFSSGHEWHLIHTRTRHEKQLAKLLERLQIEHYLPLRRIVRNYGKRKVIRDLPLFPGYLFLFGSLEDAYQVDRTEHVAQIIRVVDQITLASELDNLRLASSRGAMLEPHPFLGRGIEVEVRSGSFKGLRGIVERPTRNCRLILQVSVLRRATSLEIDVRGWMQSPQNTHRLGSRSNQVRQ